MKRPTPRPPRYAWLLTVLSVLVWPAAFWHEATTVHAVCAEHGEVLDVAAAAEPSCADRGAQAGQALGQDEDPRIVPGEESPAHEECPFVVLGQPSSPAAEGHALVPHPRSARPAVLQPEQLRHSSIALLCLAPKQSPPA